MHVISKAYHVISTKHSAWRDLKRFLDKLEMTKGGRDDRTPFEVTKVDQNITK